MATIYQEAFTPLRPVVYGRQLFALSLGHVVLLRSGDCPYVDPENSRDAEPGELAAAVWICSQKASVLREQLEQPPDEEMIQWGLDCRQFKFADAERTFVRYLTQSLRFPPAWQEGSAQQMVADWEFSVAAALIESGLLRSEVWDMPIAEALALYAAIQERRGLKLMSPQEKEEVDRINREAAQADAERAKTKEGDSDAG